MSTSTSPSERFGNQPVDAVDRELILATQSGLPSSPSAQAAW